MALRSIAGAVLRSANSAVSSLLDLGVGNPLPIGTGPLLVESTGRRSGERHRTPLLSVRVGDTVAVSTLRSASDSMANLEADPSARVRLFGRDRDATTEVVALPHMRVALLRLAPGAPG